MSDARKRIMDNISRALNRDTVPSASQIAALRQEAYAAAASPRPAWQDDRLDRFILKHVSQVGTWVRVPSIQAVAHAVTDHLKQSGLGNQCSLAVHPQLASVQWPPELDLKMGTDQAEQSRVAISVAEAGMAETGTLVLYSGPASPTKLAFLPEFHIVVLAVSNVVDHMEDVWRMLQSRGDFPPRSLNFITGPSRTADVEQTIQLGAHGPRGLHLILVDQAAEPKD